MSETESDLELIVAIDSGDIPISPENFGLKGRETEEFADLGLDPATALIVVGGALGLARFVVSIFERHRGGIRIDLGTIPPTVDRTKDIPFGTIIIFTTDDDVRIETVDEPKDAVERMVSDLLKLSMPADAAAVKAALGGTGQMAG